MCTIQRALSVHLQTDELGQRSHCVADQQLFPGSRAPSCLLATFMLVPGPYHAWCVMETDPPLHVVSSLWRLNPRFFSPGCVGNSFLLHSPEFFPRRQLRDLEGGVWWGERCDTKQTHKCLRLWLMPSHQQKLQWLRLLRYVLLLLPLSERREEVIKFFFPLVCV